jgi:protein-S-isoprenylcysteine O-methyltransferase Ste14
VFTDPFFWAFVAMFGMVAGNAIQGSPLVGRIAVFGFLVVATVTLGRVVLVLPFVVQPRFGGGVLRWTIGIAVIGLALAIMSPLLRIKPLTRPDAAEALRTRGVFGIVRHPGYLANVLWGLGWAIAFGSIVGVWLTPVWAAMFWLHALIEEEVLQQKYGATYRAYMAQVPCRLIPGIPL